MAWDRSQKAFPSKPLAPSWSSRQSKYTRWHSMPGFLSNNKLSLFKCLVFFLLECDSMPYVNINHVDSHWLYWSNCPNNVLPEAHYEFVPSDSRWYSSPQDTFFTVLWLITSYGSPRKILREVILTLHENVRLLNTIDVELEFFVLGFPLMPCVLTINTLKS